MTVLRLTFGFLIQCAPCAFLCYLPFINSLRISRKGMTIIISIFSILIPAVFVIVSLFLKEVEPDIFTLNNHVNMVFMICLLACLILYIYTVAEHIFKKIFVFVLVGNYGLILSGLSNFICAHLDIALEFDGLPYDRFAIFFFIAATIFTLPLMIFLMKNSVIPTLNIGLTGVWRSLSFITIFYFLICSFGIKLLTNEQNLSTPIILVLTALILSEFIIYYFIFQFLIELNRKCEIERQSTSIHHQMELQSEQYKRIQYNIELTQRAKHDLRHHFSLLSSMAADGHIENIRAYLNEYSNAVPETSIQKLCDNYTIDVILQYYYTLAQQNMVEFTSRIDIPDKLDILNTDICVLLGNFLENALNACMNVPLSQRFIHLNIVQVNRVLAITMDNSFDGNAVMEGDRYLSTKTTGMGIGLSSVRSIAQKYNGGTSFENDKTSFHSSVMLNTV